MSGSHCLTDTAVIVDCDAAKLVDTLDFQVGRAVAAEFDGVSTCLATDVDMSERDHSTVQDWYNSRTNQSRQERETSKIIALKSFNNWVKAVLINSYLKPGDCVFDICCGKGVKILGIDCH